MEAKKEANKQAEKQMKQMRTKSSKTCPPMKSGEKIDRTEWIGLWDQAASSVCFFCPGRRILYIILLHISFDLSKMPGSAQSSDGIEHCERSTYHRLHEISL